MSPTIRLTLRDIRTLVVRDPPAAYDAFAEMVELLTAPSAELYAKPARNLGLGLQRVLEDYARASDEIAERIRDEPELPGLEAAA